MNAGYSGTLRSPLAKGGHTTVTFETKVKMNEILVLEEIYRSFNVI